jgi:hypothetical protein
LATEQKLNRETTAKVQQRAVELTPVPDYGVMRFGEIRLYTCPGGTQLEKHRVGTAFLAFLRCAYLTQICFYASGTEAKKKKME